MMRVIQKDLYKKILVSQDDKTIKFLKARNKSHSPIVYICNFCRADYHTEEAIEKHLAKCTKRGNTGKLVRRIRIRNLYINGFTSLKEAKLLVVSLSNASKMPCLGYSISPRSCITGAILAKKEGTICHDCYATNPISWYTKPHVTGILEKRTEAVSHPQWKWAMIFMIFFYYFPLFRWHDAGDLQSVQHLADIAFIAKSCRFCKFWLPTREWGMVRKFWEMNGERPLKELYPNLKIVLSATEFDKAAPYDLAKKLGVSVSEAGENYTCPSSDQGHKCGDCRKCWDQEEFLVVYKKH